MFEIRKEFREAHPEIVEKVLSDEYAFLFNNEHLGDHICLLGLGGSYSYGTNVEGSDVDIRGVATLRREEILGTAKFEQFQNSETDTTIYSITKFFNLLSACNPNIVELIGLRDCDYLYISPIGQMILDNKDLFLSKRAVNTFGGYANAQLKRIRMATMRELLPETEKLGYMETSIENAIQTLIAKNNLEDYGHIDFRIDENQIVIDTELRGLPIDQFIDMMNVTKSVKQDYETHVGHRNQKSTEAKLNKHFLHLVRLYHTCLELLETGEIHTYRKDDHDFLMDIRSGKYLVNGRFTDEIYDYVNELEKKMNYWKEKTKLPTKANYDGIEKLLIEINRRSL